MVGTLHTQLTELRSPATESISRYLSRARGPRFAAPLKQFTYVPPILSKVEGWRPSDDPLPSKKLTFTDKLYVHWVYLLSKPPDASPYVCPDFCGFSEHCGFGASGRSVDLKVYHLLRISANFSKFFLMYLSC